MLRILCNSLHLKTVQPLEQVKKQPQFISFGFYLALYYLEVLCAWNCYKHRSILKQVYFQSNFGMVGVFCMGYLLQELNYYIN